MQACFSSNFPWNKTHLSYIHRLNYRRCWNVISLPIFPVSIPWASKQHSPARRLSWAGLCVSAGVWWPSSAVLPQSVFVFLSQSGLLCSGRANSPTLMFNSEDHKSISQRHRLEPEGQESASHHRLTPIEIAISIAVFPSQIPVEARRTYGAESYHFWHTRSSNLEGTALGTGSPMTAGLSIPTP